MKKAFSVVELIVVIVILGILAAVAIPKLAATRDDAEVVKAATNINILLSDLRTYYLAREKLSTSASDMSSVVPPVKIKNNVCLKFTKITPDGILENIEISDSGLCREVWEFSKFKELKDKIIANGYQLDLRPLSVKFNP